MTEKKDPLDEIIIRTLKVDEATTINQDERLGKRSIMWDTPAELKIIAFETKKTLIGLGKWNNVDRHFICLATPEGSLVYLNVDAIKSLYHSIMVASKKDV